jgi:DNA-binding LytR/AlgR family response regulator
MINAVAIDDEPLALEVIKTFCADIDFVELKRTFTKPNEGLKYLKKFPADLVFLDIKMPSISGLNLINSLEQNTMVIFTTAFPQYAAYSYELNAIDYLIKPINRNRFVQACNKANEFHGYMRNKSLEKQSDLFIRADFSLIKVPIMDILFIEGFGDYLKVNIQGRSTVVARMTMKEIIELLPSNDFVRIHRSFIVPFKRIVSIRNKFISICGMDLPIGNTYYDDFIKSFKSSNETGFVK